MPSFSSYVTSQWHVVRANLDDIFEGQAEVPSDVDIKTIVDNIETWLMSMVHDALEPFSVAIRGIIAPWHTLVASYKNNLQDTTKIMSSLSGYAAHQWHAARADWNMVKKGQVPANIGSIVDKVKTWIMSMVRLAPEQIFKIKTWIVSMVLHEPEHIKKIKTGIVSMGHHAIDPLTQCIIALLKRHPYRALIISTLISFPGAILIPPILLCAVCTPVLGFLGFCAGGVADGSIAAGIQSAYYGARVPAGGLFATMQSLGATVHASILTVLSSWVLIVLWLISCAVWIYLVFGILLH